MKLKVVKKVPVLEAVKVAEKVEVPTFEVPATYSDMVSFESISPVKSSLKVKDLYDMAVDLHSNCWDANYSVKEMSCYFEDFKMCADEAMGKRLGVFSPYALSQFFSRFGIPNVYAKYCMDNDAYDLLQSNLQHWIDHFGGEYMFRMFDMGDTSVIRAVLTQKYKVFDTIDIMEVCRSNIPLNRNYSVRGYVMNPERLHIRLVSDEPMNVEGEDLFMGVTIDSSDVGRSSLRMSLIVYKQVCTNGLILPLSISPTYRQIHFGAGADRFEESIVACLSSMVSVKEITENIIVKSGRKELPFVMEDEISVEKFRIGHKLSKTAMEETLKMLQSEVYGTPNVWSLINSLTEVAQKFTLETRIDIEREAGKLLVS